MKEDKNYARKNKFSPFPLIMIMFLSLSILGLFFLLNYNLNNLIENIKRSSSIIVYLKDDISQVDIYNLENRIKDINFVEKVIYYSSEEVLENFKKELAAIPDMIKNLPTNPLPSILKIYLNENDERKFEYVSNKIKRLNFVNEVDYGKYTIEKANKFFYYLKIFMFVISLILIIYTLLVVSNSIKLLLYSKSEEIKILKLLGAGNFFIKKAFYVRSILFGFLASLFSLLFLFILNYFLFNKLRIFKILNINFTYVNLNWIINFLVIGSLLGFIGCYLSLLTSSDI